MKLLQVLQILGVLDKHCACVSVIALKIPKVRLYDQVKALIFTCHKFIFLQIVVDILSAMKGVSPKGLEPMLNKNKSSNIIQNGSN